MIRQKQISRGPRLAIGIMWVYGTIMFQSGCNGTSGEQQGKFVVCGSETHGVDGQIEQVIFARQRNLQSGALGPKTEVLRFRIILRFDKIKLAGNTCNESHGIGTSTFQWTWKGTHLRTNKPFTKELLLQWNRETDLVSSGDAVANREDNSYIQIELASDTDQVLMTPVGNEQ